MATTGRDLVTRSFQNLQIAAAGEPLTADMLADGLARVNHMLAGWQTQSLTVMAVERQIFNLVSNKQTYTIGLGGDFNVPRPVHQPKGAGLLLVGLNQTQTITSITRSVNTATATCPSAHGLTAGQEIVISGCTDYRFNGTVVAETVPTTLTFTYTMDDGTAASASGSPVFQTFNTNAPIEIPRGILTDDAYQAIRLKGLVSNLFTNVYYNPTTPFGTIYLWPDPPTNVNQLVLYLESVFTGFADASTSYDYPDTPGYAEAIEYNLSVRLAGPYGRPLPPDIAMLAAESLALIKRANYKLTDLPTDPALTKNRAGGYNINTGDGGFL